MFSNLPVRFAALIGAVLLFAGAAALWFASPNGRADATTTPPTRMTAGEDPPASASPEPLAGGLDDRPKSKEEQRFARADKDDDGRVTQSEYLQARRRNFDKLDANRDGRLAFEEYATGGIQKFRTADADADGALLPGEFATTAPKPKNRQTASVETCRCPQPRIATSSDDPSQD